MGSVYLLTGRPGIGKTTAIRETLSLLPHKAGGFYTQEIKEAGVRKGFKLITLDGRETVLSHIDFSGPHHVGKYCVNIRNLESIGVAAILQSLKNSDLIVIDEIGKMELFSLTFKDAVRQSISSDKKVLGTIMLKPDTFANEIKQMPQVKLIEVSLANRDGLPKKLAEMLS
jgi:nucleoside-triphosphatase